jgi:hypothetical protein
MLRAAAAITVSAVVVLVGLFVGYAIGAGYWTVGPRRFAPVSSLAGMVLVIAASMMSTRHVMRLAHRRSN